MNRPPPGFCIVSALSAVLAACVPQVEPIDRPNIILAIGDDHGFQDFGFMGSDVALTPRLDALAAEGFVFSGAYSTASSCRPALRTLLTGLHPNQYQVRRLLHQHEHRDDDRTSTRRFETLPRILGRHGYATFQSGKHWEGTYADTGFDEGTKDIAAGADSPPGRQILRDGLEPLLDFIDRHREQPFFIWYAPKVPHLPHNPPVEFVHAYVKRGLPIEVIGYFASVSWFDAGLGQLVDHLERTGLRERTLIVYLVDNGWQEIASSTATGPLDRNVAALGGPSGKFSLYDPGFRTPLIFSWPGSIDGGRRVENLVSIADVFPTILAFAGIEAPADRAGRDLRPVVLGEEEPQSEVVIGQMPGLRTDARNGQRVSPANMSSGGNFYRDETWHYLDYSKRAPELYRIADDPNETRDLAASRPEVVAELDRRITEWRTRMETPPGPDSPER